MANAIRNRLNQHASIGFSAIEARVRDMSSIYVSARDRIESRIYSYVRENRASFTGPRLVQLMEALRTEYSDFELKYTDKLKYSLNYVVNGYYRDAMMALGLKGNDTIAGGLSKDRIKLMMDDAYDHVAGATKNMSDYTVMQLRRISARVMRESSLTGESRVAVSRRLLAANNADGMFRFIDRSNKKWTNEAYFDMLGRTLLHNNAREAYLQACADEGSDIVQVSTSGDPCPACSRLEGTLLSISGKTPGLMTVQAAMESGLFHPNCTHRLMAVPESIAEAYYDKSGKPKSGNNSSGNEASDTPEARREYRKQQESAAFEKRRQEYQQSIIKAGGSKEAAAELSSLYTPEIAKHGNPPKIIFETFKGNQGAYCLGDEIHLSANMNDWNGATPTIRHEFGHWVDNVTRWKSPELQAKVAEAAEADWMALKQQFKGRLKDLKPRDYDGFNTKSIDLFGKEYKLLNMEEKNRMIQWFDTIGSISEGAFGAGHPPSYYKVRRPNVEAVANMFCAQKSGWTEFMKSFPNLYEIVKGLAK